MKYIVMKVQRESLVMEIPIIFPESLIHSSMASHITNAMLEHWPLACITAIAAGFTGSQEIGENCYGKSDTLNKESRGHVDEHLISMSDYGSCIK